MKPITDTVQLFRTVLSINGYMTFVQKPYDLHLFYGDNLMNHFTCEVAFGIETNHKSTYKLRIKSYLI